MAAGHDLPSGYEALVPFVDEWALETQDERYAKRSSVSRKELKTFYEAMLPHMEQILKDVDQFPLGEMPQSHRTLFALALSMAEIAPHIELYRGDPMVPHSFKEARLGSGHGDHLTWQNRRPSQ